MSIKICVITPVSHLARYSVLGDFHMALSHLVLEDNGNNDYARFYKKQTELGVHTFLDNSLFELEQRGIGLGPDAVFKAADIINPQTVIATDVLFEGKSTVSSTQEFISYMKKRGTFGMYRIMAVPQGRTEGEWLDCLVRICEMPVDIIGFSKLSIPISFLGNKEGSGCVARSRVKCVASIIENDLERLLTKSNKKVHLLGGDNWTVWEMLQLKGYPWIASNDSSCAVWYGSQNMIYDRTGKIQEIILEKPDLENKDNVTQYNLTRFSDSILENIIKWHRASKA